MKKIVVLLFVAVCAKHKKYNGWSSFFVEPSTEEQLSSLASMTEKFELDFWAYPTLQREGIVIIKPEHQDGFLKILENLKITCSSHVADMRKQLDYEDFFIEKKSDNASRVGVRDKSSYDNYQTMGTINKYMANMAKLYPKKVKLVVPAKSFQGRPIHYLKVSTTNFQNKSKPVIFIDAGTHAREWIAPPTVTWAIKKLVEDVTEPDLLKRFDWILLPVVNPDGYLFSMRVDPMWRKTRSTNQHEKSIQCPGVDANRNYDFFWGEAATSSNPCSNNYGGSKPFSEIETRVVRDILHEHLDRMALYVSMHSKGSFILYPWGHNGGLSHNTPNLKRVSVAMGKAIDSHALSYFLKYKVGNPVGVLYAASGASQDYAHFLGVPLTYTFELPGYRGGFHLRPGYIQQVCRETWAGLVVGARMAGDIFVGKFNQSAIKKSLHL